MMILSTIDQIKNRLKECTSLFEFSFAGTQCNIDPFSDTDYHMACGEKEIDVQSIDEVFDTPFFNGKRLSDIADEITITDW